MDKWDQITGYCCASCRFFSPKQDDIGRCRRHAPSMAGYPVVYHKYDWCGDHKIGTNPDKDYLNKQATAFNSALGDTR